MVAKQEQRGEIIVSKRKFWDRFGIRRIGTLIIL